MWRVLLIAILIAGCAQLPPTPQDVAAKRFEPIPDKAVIYIVRTPMDSWEAGTLSLDHASPITTFRSTYYRWEVRPGPRRIAGFAGHGGLVEINVQPGRIYFLEHTVLGNWRNGPQLISLRQIDERRGRALVAQAQLL